MKINIRKYLGAFLLFLGALILIQNLSLFKSEVGSIVGAGIYGAFFIFLIRQFSKDTTQWWWFLIGVFFLGLALSNVAFLIEPVEKFSPIFGIAFAGIGFILVYLLDRSNWWALVPGSIFVSLGVIRYLEVISQDTPTNGIIFLGMGIAFLLMFLIPTNQGRMNWPLIPAVILFAMGATASLNQNLNIFSIVGPGLLILGGLLVLNVSRTNKK